LAAIAREYDAFTQRGALVAAISVDPPAANAAMVEKLRLPFAVLSDPGGEQMLKPYNSWNAAQSIAKPAIIVIAPDGREVYRYDGEDFIDRPDDADVLQALDSLNLPARPAATAPVPHVEPQPSERALRLENLGLYLRAVRIATGTLAGRMRDPHDKQELERTVAMADRYLKAQAATLHRQ
jgi:hypothetical protein